MTHAVMKLLPQQSKGMIVEAANCNEGGNGAD